MSCDPRAPSERAAAITAMAHALVETFGHRAAGVARRQRDLAVGDAASTWAEILAALPDGEG